LSYVLENLHKTSYEDYTVEENHTSHSLASTTLTQRLCELM